MFLALLDGNNDILDIIPFKKKKVPKIKKILQEYKIEQIDIYSYIKLLEFKEDKELELIIETNNDIDSINKMYVQKYKKTKNKKFINILIEKNKKLIFNVANKYKNNNIAYEDLTQEGFLGFVKAVEKFDETKDVKFSTYAYYWIEAHISTYFNFNVDGALSVNSSYQQDKFRKYQKGFLKEDELPEAVKNHIVLKNNAISIDSIVYGKESEMSIDNMLGTMDNDFNNVEEKMVIDNMLSVLSDKEKMVVIERVMYGTKLKDIAAKLNTSYQWVQYVYKRAISKLKKNEIEFV